MAIGGKFFRRQVSKSVVLASMTLVMGVTGLLTPVMEANASAETQQPIVVYSSRKEHLIKPLFEAFTEKSGIEVNYITDKAGPLLVRLQGEGERTPADLFMTVDAGNLWHAASKDLLQPIESDTLTTRVPQHLRDPENRWFGLSLRARTIVYSTDRVKPTELSTYEALGGEAFAKRLCLRTSKKVYNQSLVATMIERFGADKTQGVVESWVGNLATDVFANDTSLIKAVIAGQCDVGIVNSYYFGRLQKKEAEIPAALFWPNQGTSGVHVNISGAGVTKHAKQPALAKSLLEFLVSKEAQVKFAGLNMEYPVAAGVDLDPLVASWGSFNQDKTPLQVAGERQSDAIKLMDRAGYR